MPWPEHAEECEQLWQCQRLLERWQEGDLPPDEALHEIHEMSRGGPGETTAEQHTPEVQT